MSCGADERLVVVGRWISVTAYGGFRELLFSAMSRHWRRSYKPAVERLQPTEIGH
jgi:hypothetical protein